VADLASQIAGDLQTRERERAIHVRAHTHTRHFGTNLR
jgi:hypothetical protein